MGNLRTSCKINTNFACGNLPVARQQAANRRVPIKNGRRLER